ncbi:MAG: hypothetical protein QOH39_1612 [Verrucomicrobiota bacterium]|jgi:uncharacterized protein (TIGR04255 family)
MADAENFPFVLPERLPQRISPCPVVEAIFELRFSSGQPWTTMPGLLYTTIRDKYPEQLMLPISQIPDEVRRKEAAFAFLPVVQFLSANFVVQLGPRVVSLVTKVNEYPGWRPIAEELGWLLERIQQTNIATEGERLGVRYVDFFKTDIFSELLLELQTAGRPLKDEERQITTVVKYGELAMRLLVGNNVIVSAANGEPRRGSIMDVDAWYGPLEFELFNNVMQRFEEAHLAIKRLFFGLLKPEFLATLNPVY